MSSMPEFNNTVTLIPYGPPQMLDFEVLSRPFAALRRVFWENTVTDENGIAHTLLRPAGKNTDGSAVDLETGRAVQSVYAVTGGLDITPWLGKWLPVPYLHMTGQYREDKTPVFDGGPLNWARCRISPSIGSPTDRFHIVLAFDMQPENVAQNGSEIALSPAHIGSSGLFGLAFRYADNAAFLNEGWVDVWLRNVWSECYEQGDNVLPSKFRGRQTAYVASYLVLLEILHLATRALRIQVIEPDAVKPAEVDLVLDIARTQATGLLVEAVPGQAGTVSDSCPLRLRDFSMPELSHSGPFDTNMEFSEPDFGPELLSMHSGRRTRAFFIVSPARIGPEASRISGYAAEKDAVSALFGMHRRRPFAGAGSPARAVDISVDGIDAQKTNLVCLMIELLYQALVCINAPGHRVSRDRPDAPRHLRRVVLTVPDTMTDEEKNIYRSWGEAAVHDLWQALGWQEFYVSPETVSKVSSSFRANPDVFCQGDDVNSNRLAFVLFSAMMGVFSDHADPNFRIGSVKEDEAEQKEAVEEPAEESRPAELPAREVPFSEDIPLVDEDADEGHTRAPDFNDIPLVDDEGNEENSAEGDDIPRADEEKSEDGAPAGQGAEEPRTGEDAESPEAGADTKSSESEETVTAARTGAEDGGSGQQEDTEKKKRNLWHVDRRTVRNILATAAAVLLCVFFVKAAPHVAGYLDNLKPAAPADVRQPAGESVLLGEMRCSTGLEDFYGNPAVMVVRVLDRPVRGFVFIGNGRQKCSGEAAVKMQGRGITVRADSASCPDGDDFSGFTLVCPSRSGRVICTGRTDEKAVWQVPVSFSPGM